MSTIREIDSCEVRWAVNAIMSMVRAVMRLSHWLKVMPVKWMLDVLMHKSI